MFEGRVASHSLTRRALKKCELFQGDSICVCCTPVEMILLAQLFKQTDNYYYTRCIEYCKRGIMGKQWFYFSRHGVSQDLLKNMSIWSPRL